jgi:hypothetical protein
MAAQAREGPDDVLARVALAVGAQDGVVGAFDAENQRVAARALQRAAQLVVGPCPGALRP